MVGQAAEDDVVWGPLSRLLFSFFQLLMIAGSLPKCAEKEYQLKEKLRLLWDEPTADKGGEFLDEWCSQATASGVNGLVKMAKTLTTHRAGILAYFDCGRVTSARVEGFNNKIRWLIRQAYGYRDWEYFCLKVHHLPDCSLQVVL